MRAAGTGQFKALAKAALIIGVAVTGVAAARDSLNRGSHRSPLVARYDGSAEDLALQAYEKRHPECLLWSDWRKLCSHTEPDGTTTCRRDVLHPVAPSQPFCSVAKNGLHAQRTEREPGEQESVDRFLIGHGSNSNDPEYDPQRPFNGSTIDEMIHPACRIWGDGKKPICAQNGIGSPACSSAAVRNIKRDRPFVCMEWNPTKMCKAKKELTYVRPRDAPPMISLDTYRLLKNTPAWGLYCEK